jgi:DNA polymerase III alpha subunit (gram-positive type)
MDTTNTTNTANSKYLIIDTETGGLSPETSSLLSLSFSLRDESFKELYSIDYFLRPDNSVYMVTPVALNVNKINLSFHDATAMSYNEIKPLINSKLEMMSKEFGSKNIYIVGHNVMFDLRFLYHYIISKENLDKYVSHRILDTATIFKYLQLCNKIDASISGSLSSIAEYFNLNRSNKEAHSAKYDVETTSLILEKMINLIK